MLKLGKRHTNKNENTLNRLDVDFYRHKKQTDRSSILCVTITIIYPTPSVAMPVCHKSEAGRDGGEQQHF